jgi:hypothetical protein
MNKLTTGKASVLLLTALATGSLLGYSVSSVLAQAADARAYCHANSGSSGYNYLNNPAWDQHFENNGTPKAGHELDFFTFEDDKDCNGQVDTTPTPTPEPSVNTTPTPNLSVTPTPSEEPSPTEVPIPTPTNTEVLGTSDTDVCTNIDGIQSGVPDGWYQNGANSTECRQFQFGGAPTENQTEGQVLGASTESHVLGASTLAATGSTANYLMMLGLILSGVSIYGLITPAFFKKN